MSYTVSPSGKSSDKNSNTNRAERLSQFLFASPTPFHTVENAKGELLQAGFQQLHEAESWSALQKARPGEGFFCLRGGSLIAWICGTSAPWEARSGLRLAGAHTDSPAFKLKLDSAQFEFGVLTCHVSVYGSPIFAAHADRSMAVAGIAVESDGSNNSLRLLHIGKPVAVLPNLAIHLNREANNKLSYNAQTQLKAVFGLQPVETESQSDAQAPDLLRRQLGLKEHEAFDLQLCSAQAPQLIGLEEELLSGARLDDTSMVYLLLDQLVQLKSQNAAPANWPIAIFCNGEEVGSRTYEGAASNFTANVLQRIVRNTVQFAPSDGQNDPTTCSEVWARTQACSFFLSLDGAHASHPCYPEAFDPDYELHMGAGPAVKQPNGASYSSEVFSIAQIRAIAAKADGGSGRCRLQSAVPRSDKPTGSTIGPILASQLGIRGVDIGLPMYAMHSIQETISLRDYISLQHLVQEYYYPS